MHASDDATEESESAWARMSRMALTAWQNAPNFLVPPLETDKGFCFVCGCGHSGTTLLAARLGNHPNVYLVGRESGAFRPQNGALCSRQISTEWVFQASAAGKRVIVEKTPRHVHSVRAIRRVLPAAKLILITRNPLDTVASLRKRLGTLQASVSRWQTDNRQVLRLRRQPNTLLLRYEDLTGSPESSLREAIEFLDLGWNAAVLEAGRSAYDRVDHSGNMKTRAAQVREEIRPRIGTWNEALTPDEARHVWKSTEELAAELGYRADGFNPDGLVGDLAQAQTD